MGVHDPTPMAGKRTLVFDYVATLRPPIREDAASEARVRTLLHACGMQYGVDEVTKSAKLTRLMPTFMFNQAIRKRTMAAAGNARQFRVVGYKQCPGNPFNFAST